MKSYTKSIIFLIGILAFFQNNLFAINLNHTGFDMHYQVGYDYEFDKPVILLEGFDVSDEESAFDLYYDWTEIYFDEPDEDYYLYDLLISGYDIIALSYSNPYKSLHDNAQHLKDFLVEVNNHKINNTHFENIIIGESMGGVIARIALAELEDEGYDHETGLYISYDSPHKGANIPLGIQEFAHDAKDITKLGEVLAIFSKSLLLALADHHLVDKPVDALINSLESTAARQLVIHHRKNNVTDMFLAMQTDLNNLGFPENCVNISLLNGNNGGILSNFSSDANLFHSSWGECNTLTDYLVDINTSKANVTGYKVSQLRLRSAPFCVKLYDKKGYGDFGSFFYDNAPGGKWTFHWIDDEWPTSSSGTKEFCFIPSVSAIALDDNAINTHGLTYYNYNNGITNRFLIENNLTPFDNIYAPGSNSYQHLRNKYVKVLIAQIIEEQIMWDKMYLQNRTIKGDRDFEAFSSITLGRDVRNFSDHYNGETGDFIIESGKTYLHAPEINFEPGFEVKNGAEFEIK